MEYLVDHGTREQLGDKWQIATNLLSQERISIKTNELNQRLSGIESQVASGNMLPEVATIIRDNINLQKRFLNSRHIIINNELVTIPHSSDEAFDNEQEGIVISNVLSATAISIQDGAKVVVESNDEHYVVIIECILPERARGLDYAAKVFVDKVTGEISNQILAP
ncbi:MAG: hypothetical protein LBN38_08260 [Verrucomicrobiota bacterium]|nr:hypothetical protein [Verrucomicrobiota bacterium]